MDSKPVGQGGHSPFSSSLLYWAPRLLVEVFSRIPMPTFDWKQEGEPEIAPIKPERVTPAPTPTLTPVPARPPDVFDRLRDVYREYFPETPEAEAAAESSDTSAERVVQCGWKMAGVVPYGQQILTAGAALGLLLAFFAFKRRKVIINVIQPQEAVSLNHAEIRKAYLRGAYRNGG